MGWFGRLTRGLFGGGTPTYDGVGMGRRALAWMPGNPGAVAALLTTQSELRAKSRDLVRRNAWAAAGIEAFVANAIGTGIKPQSLMADPSCASRSRRCGATGPRRPTRGAHRLLRPAGTGLPRHARRRRGAGAAALPPARGCARGRAAAAGAGTRAPAGDAQHGCRVRQRHPRRHRVRPARAAGGVSPLPFAPGGRPARADVGHGRDGDRARAGG